MRVGLVHHSSSSNSSFNDGLQGCVDGRQARVFQPSRLLSSYANLGRGKPLVIRRIFALNKIGTAFNILNRLRDMFWLQNQSRERGWSLFCTNSIDPPFLYCILSQQLGPCICSFCTILLLHSKSASDTNSRPVFHHKQDTGLYIGFAGTVCIDLLAFHLLSSAATFIPLQRFPELPRIIYSVSKYLVRRHNRIVWIGNFSINAAVHGVAWWTWSAR